MMPSISAARLTRASISGLAVPRARRLQRDVAEYGHVGIERVVLEHHGHVAVARAHVVDHLAADLDVALVDLLEAGDGAQQRALAAAGRADQNRELAVGNVEIDAAHGVDRTEAACGAR